MRIRGNWIATREFDRYESSQQFTEITFPATRRQNDQDLGPAFDGSQGVDSEDIFNIPQIGFGTFQLFPDQNSYGVDDPNLTPFENTVQQGVDWIQQQAASAARHVVCHALMIRN